MLDLFNMFDALNRPNNWQYSAGGLFVPHKDRQLLDLFNARFDRQRTFCYDPPGRSRVEVANCNRNNQVFPGFSIENAEIMEKYP